MYLYKQEYYFSLPRNYSHNMTTKTEMKDFINEKVKALLFSNCVVI